MHLDLVSIETDTHPLDALFYQPDAGASGRAALLMHGNCKNFYTGPARFLAPAGWRRVPADRRGDRRQSSGRGVACAARLSPQMDTAGTFSVLIILSIVGVIIHKALRIVERRFLFWSGDAMRMAGGA